MKTTSKKESIEIPAVKSKHTSTNWLADLKALNPCSDGYAFASKFKTWQKCWDNIERGDWSLWVLGKLSGAPESDNRKKLVLAACECARTALKFTVMVRFGNQLA